MNKRLIAAAVFILLAACSSMGSLGDAVGGILGSTGTSNPSDVTGSVVAVDTSARRIDLNVNTVNNLRQSNSNASVYYDANTVVRYNNSTYAVTDLERGDEISIRGTTQNGTYVASEITVVRNVRG